MSLEAAKQWVEEVARLGEPDDVVWCDGSEEERDRLVEVALRDGVLHPLNQDALPGCWLHRSHPDDVARTEHLTFICTPKAEDVGPTNNWMSPEDAYARCAAITRGAMRGRRMYVVPFVMGPPGSPFARVGVQVTDSVYVAINMRIMTRMGKVAMDLLAAGAPFTRCTHTLADLDPARRLVCHFPDDDTIWSVGSGYGGNALLGKKCLALRIAGVHGRNEGWLAEHMLIMALEGPDGQRRYVAGAFPSACGKTNLSMLVPPPALARQGWRVQTLGDDIAWLRPGADGRLWAVNPEAGFFGVAPGTSHATNPNAMATIARNTIYTNVAVQPDGRVWWEGHDDPPMPGMVDWRGKVWDRSGKAAHPNSRFTAPASQCPSIAAEWERPEGVPLDAILFGARRATTVPLVYQARDWAHGVFMGATLASETTAAATGQVGVLRRDPMAMLPFCGYHMGDYFAHWLRVGAGLSRPPHIFGVNWFRTGADGKFLWPGYADNLRVLAWVLDRCAGRGAANDTPIGAVPTRDALDLRGLDVDPARLDALLRVDPEEWAAEAEDQRGFFDRIGDRLPAELRAERDRLAAAMRVRVLSMA